MEVIVKIKYVILIIGGIGIPYLHATQQISIVNPTQSELDISYNIPPKSISKAEIEPLGDPQLMLLEGIKANSIHDILNAIKAGADLNADCDGRLPIIWAQQLKKFGALELLRRYGAQPMDLNYMLYTAILNNRPLEIQYALDAGASLTEKIHQQKDALTWAVLLSKRHAVAYLLQKGSNPNEKYTGPLVNTFQSTSPINFSSLSLLQCALYLHDVQTALLLIKAGADFSSGLREMTILEFILWQIDSRGSKHIILEMAEQLIKRGYPLNGSGEKSVFVNNQVCQYGSIWRLLQSQYFFPELIDLFIRYGADPNQLISPHWRPLHLAIQANNYSAVDRLLKWGADPNLKACPPANSPRHRQTEQTALGYAASLNHLNNSEVKLLLQKYKGTY